MNPKPRPWNQTLSAGAFSLLVLGHALHDILEGVPWFETVVPSGLMILAFLSFSGLFRLFYPTKIRSFIFWGIEACIGIFFGVLFLLNHSVTPLVSAKTAILGPAVGLSLLLAWVLLFYLPSALHHARIQKVAEENLRRESEIALLRASLRPHFLLNTLNTISSLVTDEPRQARRLIEVLGDLLRDSLEQGPELRPLEDDLRWLQHYAEILEERHRGTLTFKWDTDQKAGNVLIPKLLLQPLIENAVKYGALRRGQDGIVTVRTRLKDDCTSVEVRDNGRGIAPETPEGLGLRLVRERLESTVPGSSFRIDSTDEGTCATIELPRNSKEI